MPLSDINALYKMAYDRQQSEEERKKAEAEAIEDSVEDMI